MSLKTHLKDIHVCLHTDIGCNLTIRVQKGFDMIYLGSFSDVAWSFTMEIGSSNSDRQVKLCSLPNTTFD